MGYTPHVLVIGGGVLGTGIARDLAIRGLDVTLVERGTLTAGTTGQSYGVLDGGARFATSDADTKLVSRERETLQEIGGRYIENTGGLFVRHSDGSVEQFEQLRTRLDSLGLEYEHLDGPRAREIEPALSPEVAEAIRVPDAVVDLFGLTVANAHSAHDHGARIRTHTEVTEIAVEDGTVGSVIVQHDPSPARTHNRGQSGESARTDGGTPGRSSSGGSSDRPRRKDGDRSVPGTGEAQFRRPEHPSVEKIDADYVVNATGGWAGTVAALAGFDIDVTLVAETVLTAYENPLESVVTRWMPAEDELYPDAGTTAVGRGETVVLGSTRREISAPEEASAFPDDVESIRDSVTPLVPAVGDARILRADCAIRAHPEVETEDGCRLVDHGDVDDCWGMTTVVGGSLTTHRHIAERVADDICTKFGIRRECQTDEIVLPGSKEQPSFDEQSEHICECQSVARGAVRRALADDTGNDVDLDEVRIRTGAAMGHCQGGRCAHRLAAELYPTYDGPTTRDALDSLLEGRWAGQRPALGGEQLRQAMQTYVVSAVTMNRTAPDVSFVASKTEEVRATIDDEERTTSKQTVGLAAFDDGQQQRGRDSPPWGERPV